MQPPSAYTPSRSASSPFRRVSFHIYREDAPRPVFGVIIVGILRPRGLAVIRLFLAAILSSAPGLAFADDTISDWRGVEAALQEGEVDSNGVAIHCHTVGEGPLVVLIHGIGDLWLDWRHQIPTLAEDYQVVAMTQRGFDKSDQPEGVEHYTSAKVAEDIAALIAHFDRDKAIIMAYDSGGFHAWYFAMAYPEMTDRLVTVGASGKPRSRARLESRPAAAEHLRSQLSGGPKRRCGVYCPLERSQQPAQTGGVA